MIEAMLSSTVLNMGEERAAMDQLLREFGIFSVVGAAPAFAGVGSASSIAGTREIAKRAGLYILLLGDRYGFVAPGTQLSATEREFDAAVETDPTKVLVYLKTGIDPDPEQVQFIARVRDYQKGYWTVDYQNSTELARHARDDINRWLEQRILLKDNHDIYDQFLFYALSIKPTSDTEMDYKKTKESVLLNYRIFDTEYILDFKRRQIATDFWGCVSQLIASFEAWKRSGYVSS
ncbi:DUF4062 domain-containing protein [Deinococcus psychrotolerans]|uniref:DUF4062 domain-containing protein n=1 Tax=Deinococcus psychrotolerans TaxID=2489213 RepID=UPI001F14E738|nr:DUF4062 domain-containing protein [Deinococcus psychrotolerans]